MTFGLRNVDDILVLSADEFLLREHLRILFRQLQNYGILINFSKCIFGAREVTFLGYRISSEGT